MPRRLDSNALICDCEMLWLVQMLQHRLRETQAAATCQYPVAMQGKALSSMSASDFHCSESFFFLFLFNPEKRQSSFHKKEEQFIYQGGGKSVIFESK